jgi:nucleoside-diphosphate-sugar epimerase
MKNILIIGSAGYIGSRLTLEFKDKYSITTLDACWFEHSNSPDIIGDFYNFDKTFYSKFDIIILLAAHSSVKMCEGPMLSAYNNNVRNFVHLFSKLNSNQKIIYASSSSVYGDVGSTVVDENHNDFIPHNHYDVTKHIIDLYAPKFNIQYYGLRFGTVNGYSPTVRKDIMINSMTHSALTSGEIKLYIKDIIRPILGIEDLVRAIETIIENESDNRGIYNLASFNATAEDIAKKVNNVTNTKIVEYVTDPTNISNSKLQTKCYNFSINCEKFIRKFNFEFKETVESITKSLINNYPKIQLTTRDNFKHYE